MPSEKQLKELSLLINMPVEQIKDRLNRKDERTGKRKEFIYLKRQLSKDVADKITPLDIKGLAFQTEPKRHYPSNQLYAHIIGFTNIDGKGQEGMELSREKDLQGINGIKMVLRDNKGNIVESLDSSKNRDQKNGNNLVLSIDHRIQILAYEELSKAISHHKAKAGSIVVMDAKTGEVLALANLPTYNPNNPAKVNSDQRRNRAITDMIEPGSSMKPFSIAKALDSGKVNVNNWFNTNPYKIGNATVRDTHNYPSLDVRGIMQKSSNVGTSRLSEKFKPQEMYEFYKSIGVGQRMHSGFPGETPGLLRRWETWQPIEQATMSFGYGLQLSLLQLTRAYTVITNDGELLPVSFEKLDKKPKGERIIKSETAKTLQNIMVSVTEKGGTGTMGAVDGFNVGAKTGTARKLVNGKYTNDKHIASFIGFAPAENPKLIVAVSIDEPTVNGYYGGVVAGPVFKNVMEGGLNISGLLPKNWHPPLHSCRGGCQAIKKLEQLSNPDDIEFLSKSKYNTELLFKEYDKFDNTSYVQQHIRSIEDDIYKRIHEIDKENELFLEKKLKSELKF